MTPMMRGTIVWMLLTCAAQVACGKAAGTAEETSEATPETTPETTKGPVTAAETSSPSPDKITVYYFHGTRRCPTCLGIQKAIEDTIEERFAKEIEAGMLLFESLNFEEEKNQPFVEKYQLSFSTMIIEAQIGGTVVKWENAGKIWDYAHTPDELKTYVEKSVRTYLTLLGASE